MQTQQLHIIPVSQHTAGRPAAVVQLQGDPSCAAPCRPGPPPAAAARTDPAGKAGGCPARRNSSADSSSLMVRSSLAVAALMSLTACRDSASAPDGPDAAPDTRSCARSAPANGSRHPPPPAADGLRRQLLRCILLCLLHCYRLQDCVRYSLLFCWMRYRLIA